MMITNPSIIKHLDAIQIKLKQLQIGGWLLYDFRHSNTCMLNLLNLDRCSSLTRRFFYWIPQQGLPVLIRHKIEAGAFKNLEELHLRKGLVEVYSSRIELETILEKCLEGISSVAMEVSPLAQIPYLSCVDLGTIQWIERIGPRVESSTLLMSEFLARWDQEALNSHLKAARALEEETLLAFAFVHEQLSQNKTVTEWQLQQRLKQRLEQRSMRVDHGPIVAVNANAADPHYQPTVENSSAIELGHVLLIDAWCSEDKAQSRFADICRMAYIGSKVPSKIDDAFKLVKQAQERAFHFIDTQLQQSACPLGWQVDAYAREVIEVAGYGPYFNHRLGHNIDLQDHGSGTHLDNYESHDIRPLLKKTCYSVEPGIYFQGQFGIRLESDVYIDSQLRMTITGGVQSHWYLIDPANEYHSPIATSPLYLEV
jgi:Xaa-Pro dipeptidase